MADRVKGRETLIPSLNFPQNYTAEIRSSQTSDYIAQSTKRPQRKNRLSFQQKEKSFLDPAHSHGMSGGARHLAFMARGNLFTPCSRRLSGEISEFFSTTETRGSQKVYRNCQAFEFLADS